MPLTVTIQSHHLPLPGSEHLKKWRKNLPQTHLSGGTASLTLNVFLSPCVEPAYVPFLPSSHAHWLCSRPGGGRGGVIMRMRTQALPVLALRATHPQEARQFSTTIPRENRLDLQTSSLRLPEEGRKPRGLGNVGRGADKERSPPSQCVSVPKHPPQWHRPQPATTQMLAGGPRWERREDGRAGRVRSRRGRPGTRGRPSFQENGERGRFPTQSSRQHNTVTRVLCLLRHHETFLFINRHLRGCLAGLCITIT